jgi:4-cresol dehydrogenase (hydroxylating) flavoprotein subunit
MPALPQAAIDEWRLLLGTDRVLVGENVAERYRSDTLDHEMTVPLVLRVAAAGQIPNLMCIAQRHRVAVHPISTGHNWGYGTALPTANGTALVDLSDLCAILDFDAELGVVTLEPGVTQRMLAEYLDNRGYNHMVPVTGAGPNCSIVANALERGYGITPHVDHFGAMTDVEAVLADGSIYQSALCEAGNPELARLFKWGIGPYVNGLFTQSGFGIVTRASIALAPRPECTKVCLFSLAEDKLLEEAARRLQQLLSQLPGVLGGVNLMNQHRVLSMTAPYPAAQELDSHGLIPASLVKQLGRDYQIAPWTGFATLYGKTSIVQAAQKEIRRALKGVASRLLFVSPTQAAWLSALAQRIPGSLGQKLSKTAATLKASLQLVRGRPNETALSLAYWRSRLPQPDKDRDPARDGCGLLWYAPLIPMRPADVRRFVDFVRQELPAMGLEPLITLTSQGDRLFDSTVPLLFDKKNPAASASASAGLEHLIEHGKSLGFYPYRLHIQSQAAHLARQEHSARLISRLRQALDPNDLLAPGRYAHRGVDAAFPAPPLDP